MQSKIELPPKYYLSHFREFLEVLETQYRDFLEDHHLKFLFDFYSLSEDAQCLLVRMINRKGNYFFKDSLKYQEIEKFEDGLLELREMHFVRELREDDHAELLKFLPKPFLISLATEQSVDFKKSWSREKILELLLGKTFSYENENLLVQGRTDELSYLMFLYFGRIEESLTLYTLRDLGIKKVNKQKTKARYRSREEALSHYFYAALSEKESIDVNFELWPDAKTSEALELREALLISLSEHHKSLSQFDEALTVLARCTRHPGREKYVRLLYQLNKLEECQRGLDFILQNPSSDLEHLFAVDFMERKFNKKKTSILTDTLRNSRKLPVDESYFRKPEQGLIDSLNEQGIQSFHVENYLWNALFATLFWEEIFESEKMPFTNEFETVPYQIYEGKFYDLHKEEIERKLQLFSESVLDKYENFKERPNGIFGHSPELPELLKTFISHSPKEGIAEVLRSMARDFGLRSTGFPDLMVIEDNKVKFIEVKAPGDVLKEKQLLQILLLKKAGFEVEVVQIEYIFNPNQLYVVVDLETTGGMLPYHRITEIGAVKVRNGEVIDEYQTLVNPGRSISREIQALTGITNEMVKTAPAFAEVADAFNEFSKDAIFVAHNVGFDYGFLQSEFERLDRIFTRPHICTKVSMKKHYPGLESYSLKNLTGHFQIPLETHHRALCDARAAAQLLFLINKKRSGLD